MSTRLSGTSAHRDNEHVQLPLRTKNLSDNPLIGVIDH